MVSAFPFGQDFIVLREAMNQLLEDSFVPARGTRGVTGDGSIARALPLDVYATPDEVVILAAVPGMDPKDLEVSIDQNVVTLAGSVPTATESEQGKNANWYLHELWHGQFRRSITLPFEVEAGKAEATFENGVVRITLPKAERAKPHKIAIKSGSGRQQEAISAGGKTQPSSQAQSGQSSQGQMSRGQTSQS
jgi:HSP20 family protein